MNNLLKTLKNKEVKIILYPHISIKPIDTYIKNVIMWLLKTR